jgi:hypothetical protein
VEAEADSFSRRLAELDQSQAGGNTDIALIRRRSSRSILALVALLCAGVLLGRHFCGQLPALPTSLPGSFM